MTRSFDTSDTNVVTTPGGQRVHKWHAAQSEVVRADFYEVRSGVWCLVGNGLSNQTFIEAPEGIIAVDTGESIEEIREALRRLREFTSAPIAAVIYTHFHYVEGTKAILDEGNHATPLPIYGHERLAFNKERTLGEISPAYSRGIVEQFRVAIALGRLDDLFERSVRKLPACDRGIGLVDIGLVMLAMVELQRFRRHVRRQRVLGIGKVGQRESHGDAPFL